MTEDHRQPPHDARCPAPMDVVFLKGFRDLVVPCNQLATRTLVTHAGFPAWLCDDHADLYLKEGYLKAGGDSEQGVMLGAGNPNLRPNIGFTAAIGHNPPVTDHVFSERYLEYPCHRCGLPWDSHRTGFPGRLHEPDEDSG